MDDDQLNDYRDRMEQAARTLAESAEAAGNIRDYDMQRHLDSKRQGVLLALDHLRAY